MSTNFPLRSKLSKCEKRQQYNKIISCELFYYNYGSYYWAKFRSLKSWKSKRKHQYK